MRQTCHILIFCSIWVGETPVHSSAFFLCGQVLNCRHHFRSKHEQCVTPVVSNEPVTDCGWAGTRQSVWGRQMTSECAERQYTSNRKYSASARPKNVNFYVRQRTITGKTARDAFVSMRCRATGNDRLYFNAELLSNEQRTFQSRDEVWTSLDVWYVTMWVGCDIHLLQAHYYNSIACRPSVCLWRWWIVFT